MTEPAREPQPTTEGPALGTEREEGSGRFLIDPTRASGTMIPPAEDGAPSVAALAEIEPREVEPLAVEALQIVAPRVSLPPPVPAFALSKSARAVAPVASVPAPAPASTPELDALHPLYRGLSISERAEPRVDDLSFHLDNPFARSSLVAPPKKPFPVAKAVLGTVGVAMLAALGYATTIHQLDAPRTEASLPTPHVVTKPASHAPIVPAAVTAVEAPAVAVVAPVAEPVAAVAQPVAPIAAPTKPRTTATGSASAKTEAKTEPKTAAHDEPTAAEEAPSAAEPSPAADTSAPAPEEEALPETPTREQIMASFEKVRDDLVTCADGGHGLLTTGVTISGAGRVTYATVDGVFAGTPQGSCMARALRKASFPRFSSPNLKISFPFSL